MLDGVRTAINTVTFATPYLGGAIGLLVATTPGLRRQGIVSRALGGALTGGIIATGWEFTVNSSDPTPIKVEIITGSAGIGAGAAVIGGML